MTMKLKTVEIRDKPDKKIWVMRSREEINIKDMKDSHIKNAIKFLNFKHRNKIENEYKNVKAATRPVIFSNGIPLNTAAKDLDKKYDRLKNIEKILSREYVKFLDSQKYSIFDTETVMSKFINHISGKYPDEYTRSEIIHMASLLMNNCMRNHDSLLYESIKRGLSVETLLI